VHSDGEALTQAFAKLFPILDWNVNDAWPSWIAMPLAFLVVLPAVLWVSNVSSISITAFCLLRQFSPESIIFKLFFAFLRQVDFDLLRSSEELRYLSDEFRQSSISKSFRDRAYWMRSRIHATSKSHDHCYEMVLLTSEILIVLRY